MFNAMIYYVISKRRNFYDVEDVLIRIHQYEDFVECLILQQIEPIYNLFIKIKTKI